MPIPYIILVLGYAFIVSLFLYIIIALKGKWILKFCLIPIILWFGLFLYYIPPQLAGYPSEQDILQEQVIVRYFIHQSPTKTTEGHVYIVVDTRFFKDIKEQTAIDKINPLTYTDISQNEHLRLYRIPWDEEMVKAMNKAQKRKQLIIISKNSSKDKGKGKGEGTEKGEKGKKGDKKGQGEGEGEKGSNKNGGGEEKKGNGKYKVKALTPNEIFKKTD